MDSLTLLGLCSIAAMVVFYVLEDFSPEFILGFAGASLFAAFYTLMQGLWPFALLAAAWAVLAFRRWSRKSTGPNDSVDPYQVFSRQPRSN